LNLSSEKLLSKFAFTFNLYRYTVGTPQASDVCVLTEDDELFCVGFGRTSSGEYMLLESESTETNEVRVVLLAAPGGEAALMQPRRLGHRYYPEHRGGHWYILTNRGGRVGQNTVQLMTASVVHVTNLTPGSGTFHHVVLQ
jgi:protease II